jgi:ATP-dependent DNA helicase RecQ
LSRKSTEGIAAKLKKQGIRAAAYHAGMPAEKRSKIQEDFINDNIDVMCATIAFGMGIDKSNVRWVIHYNLPKNIEGYYQEIGRAGRDGVNSDTLLFYSYADVMQLRKFAKGSSNEDYQLAKLERMQQYSESLNCRRQALLSYFGEALENDCGFCDNCKNPPEIIDGTVIAQKALSAVYRLEGTESMNNLVDFIRGSNNAYIQSKGLSKLRTYGVGSEIAWKDWQAYIIQMLNQGLVEIAFHQNNRIKLTPLSHKVLFEKRPVKLARNIEVDHTPVKVKGKKAPKNYVTDDLFEALRTLRSALAKEQGVPPYIIFSDASLKNMAADKPKNFSDFLDIEGVGQAKLEKFGEVFLSVINNFELAQEKKKKPAKKSTKGNTLGVTFELYQKGKTIAEISSERDLSENTILNHLVQLYQDNKNVDLLQFTTIENLGTIKQIQQGDPSIKTLKPMFVACEEKINYEEIKICLAILEQKKGS